MASRKAVVAGRFYPGQPEQLKKEIHNHLDTSDNASRKDENPWAVMLPHAGYMFCGDVIGKTLAGQTLPKRLVVICPNHTGYGTPFSIWPEGEWQTPLGPVRVDNALASELLASNGGYMADTTAHLGEHSIEVILPFLLEQRPDLSIVPICVGTQNPGALETAAHALAQVLARPENADVGLVISSDMNHYEDEKTTLAKDDLALARARAADPSGLLNVVLREKISMCGAGPLALALFAARELGGVDVELVAHETSGKASGDYAHTVGYAGLRLFLKAA